MNVHLENFCLVVFIAVGFVLCGLYAGGVLRFELGSNAMGVLGTAVQALASLFAIVFSVSLVAIQLCAENLSHRLIRLYVENWNFVVPFGLNSAVLLFNLFLLSNNAFGFLAVHGVILSVVVVLVLIPFFIYTIRFLMIESVVRMLLRRVKTYPRILSDNFADDELYLEYLQPIEDIISSCAKKGDYATAQGLIESVLFKMYGVLVVVIEMMKKTDKASSDKLLVFMSAPFARLFEGVAVSANKNDTIEITIYIIGAIADFVEKFGDARFVPAFKIFDGAIEHIRSQAKYRFSSAEYKVDFARLEIAISRARVIFSGFVE